MKLPFKFFPLTLFGVYSTWHFSSFWVSSDECFSLLIESKILPRFPYFPLLDHSGLVLHSVLWAETIFWFVLCFLSTSLFLLHLHYQGHALASKSLNTNMKNEELRIAVRLEKQLSVVGLRTVSDLIAQLKVN